MGSSADQLRRDIENTRSDLGETLDAIGDRVSPGRVMERRKNRLFNGVRSARDRVMGTAADAGHTLEEAGHAFTDAAGDAVGSIREAPDAVRHQTQGSPLAAGAVAFGVGVVAAAIFPASQREKQTTEQLMDKVGGPLKDEVTEAGREIAEHLKEPAAEALEEVRDAAAEGRDAVADTARQAGSDTQQAVRGEVEDIRSDLQGDQRY